MVYAKNALIVAVAVCVSLLFAELALRSCGYIPGKLNYKWATEVDLLTDLKGVYTDKRGILRVSPEGAVEVNSIISQCVENGEDPPAFDHRIYHLEPYLLPRDFVAVNRYSVNNSFTKHLKYVREKRTKSLFDSLVIRYSTNPINAEGFKGLALYKGPDRPTSVLLLGDSYTWGHNCTNITNSFADDLIAKGYYVYNTGIGGTDPPQYLAIAQEIVPKLQPEFVILNFNLANDLQYFKRTVSEKTPVLFPTNAGFFVGCPQGYSFSSKEEVYKQHIANSYIPAKAPFDSFCTKFVITTFLWRAMVNLGLIQIILPKPRGAMVATPASTEHLREIQKICDSSGSKLLVSIIPRIVHENNVVLSVEGIESYPGLFNEFILLNISLPYGCYSVPDEHFNDKGHRLYANFLDSCLKAYMIKEAFSQSR